MFHQTFPQGINFILKIKVRNLPQQKNFRNSQKFPRTMSACPLLFPCLMEVPPCFFFKGPVMFQHDLQIITQGIIFFGFQSSHTYWTNISREKIENTSLAAKGALAHRLQRSTDFKIQNGHQGAPKLLIWSGKRCTLGFRA